MHSQLKFISVENRDWIWFLLCRILLSGSLQGWKPASSYKFQKRNGSKKWILKWNVYWRKAIFLMLLFTFCILEDYSVILPSFSHCIYDNSYGRAVLLKLPVLDSWLVTAGHNCSFAMDWGNLKTLICPNGTPPEFWSAHFSFDERCGKQYYMSNVCPSAVSCMCKWWEELLTVAHHFISNVEQQV